MRDVLLCLAVVVGLVVVLVQMIGTGDLGAVALVVALLWLMWRVLRSRFVVRR